MRITGTGGPIMNGCGTGYDWADATGGINIGANSGNIRSLDPSAYRLAVKLDGSLVLQGAYKYIAGKGGVDWEDIPTHIITENIEVIP